MMYSFPCFLRGLVVAAGRLYEGGDLDLNDGGELELADDPKPQGRAAAVHVFWPPADLEDGVDELGILW